MSERQSYRLLPMAPFGDAERALIELGAKNIVGKELKAQFRNLQPNQDINNVAMSIYDVVQDATGKRPKNLSAAIHRMKGDVLISTNSEGVFPAYIVRENPFSDRQEQIINLALNGLSGAKIAEELNIEKDTVRNILRGNKGLTGLQKIGVYGLINDMTGEMPTNLREAINILYEHGLVVSPDPLDSPSISEERLDQIYSENES